MRPIRSSLAFVAFVLAASVFATLLFLGAFGFRDQDLADALTDFPIIILMYAPTVAFFTLLIFVPLLLALKARFKNRGTLDMAIGAIVGVISTLFVTPSWSLYFSIAPYPYDYFGLLLFVFLNALSGAVGGLAYWLTAGPPRHKTHPQPTSS